MKYVIIGGVAGGASAAASIRRNDETAKIIMLEKGDYISYANCGLPYYIGNVIKERDDLLLQTSDSFSNRFNVEVRQNNEVVEINSQKKEISVKNNKGEIYKESYDKLLISTGAKPVIPSFEGIDSRGIFTLRNVNDSDKIKDYIQEKKVKKAVIIGAGFIGLEMAENFYNLGIEVSLVEKSKQVHHALDFSMASILHSFLYEKGVNLFLDNEILKFSEESNEIKVHLKDGTVLTADLVLLAMGVTPNTELAKQVGIQIGKTGGIWVDAYMQTSIPDIYAVGDAVEYPHPLTGIPWINFMANPASRQAGIAAYNMVFGNSMTYEGSIGTIIAKVFDMVGAATGLNERRMTEFGIPFESVYIHNNSHAEYYPGATSLFIKIIFDPKTGKLFGGQIVGVYGVDKRIDQIALIIKKGGTIDDLMKLEQAYAPPFSSVKDPIAVAGYVAKNVISGKMPIVHWQNIDKLDRKEVQILDVRTKNEFNFGAIAGAINIPLDDLRNRLTEISKVKPIYLYCATGKRAYFAQQILMQNGFENVYNLTGGEKIYKYATQPLIEQES